VTRHPDPAADRHAARLGGRRVLALCEWWGPRHPPVYIGLSPREGDSDGAAVNRFKRLVGARLRGPIRVYDAAGVCVWDSRDGGGP
jgi:hypothetical protein